MSEKSKIRLSFNVGLFLFIIVALFYKGAVEVLFESEAEINEVIFIETLFQKSFVLGFLPVVGLIIFEIVLITWGAILIRVVWNRLISDILNLKEICFQESLTLSLIFTLIIELFA